MRITSPICAVNKVSVPNPIVYLNANVSCVHLCGPVGHTRGSRRDLCHLWVGVRIWRHIHRWQTTVCDGKHVRPRTGTVCIHALLWIWSLNLFNLFLFLVMRASALGSISIHWVWLILICVKSKRTVVLIYCWCPCLTVRVEHVERFPWEAFSLFTVDQCASVEVHEGWTVYDPEYHIWAHL